MRTLRRHVPGPENGQGPMGIKCYNHVHDKVVPRLSTQPSIRDVVAWPIPKRFFKPTNYELFHSYIREAIRTFVDL